MNDIKSICLILFLLIFIAPSMAQIDNEKSNRHERIEALKVSFLTTKLELSSDEAKVFWPVYDQYQNEMRDLRTKRKQRWQNRRDNLEGLSDKEITELIDDNIKFEQQELDIRKKYHQEFKNVLPAIKVAQLYEAEREFKIMLINKLKERERK